MILSTAQAKALYDAMCAMNNVGGTLCARFDGIRVEAWDTVTIEGPDSGLDGLHTTEYFPTQDVFAVAYKLA